jgi:hypothetical protein
VTLLDQIVRILQRHAIPHALIGASALAVHGVSRSTLDQDLLVTDPRTLDEAMWRELSGASIDRRCGAHDDPWQA